MRSCFTKRQFYVYNCFELVQAVLDVCLSFSYVFTRKLLLSKLFLVYHFVCFFFLSRRKQAQKNLVTSISVLKINVITVLCFNCCC